MMTTTMPSLALETTINKQRGQTRGEMGEGTGERQGGGGEDHNEANPIDEASEGGEI